MELHTVFEELPSCVVGDMVPVVLTTFGAGIVPAVTAVDGIIVAVLPAMDADTVFGSADVDGIEPAVPPTADMEATGMAGVPGVICPVGMEQVTTVPGKKVCDRSRLLRHPHSAMSDRAVGRGRLR